ncbi:MAG TPA: hypothetical protein VGM33_22880 [Baekduia sp.]
MDHEVQVALAQQLEVDTLFTGLLLELQELMGRLVRVEAMWGLVTNAAVIDGLDGRMVAVVLDYDVERVVIVGEEQLRDVVWDVGGDADVLYVQLKQRTVVFEVVPEVIHG